MPLTAEPRPPSWLAQLADAVRSLGPAPERGWVALCGHFLARHGVDDAVRTLVYGHGGAVAGFELVPNAGGVLAEARARVTPHDWHDGAAELVVRLDGAADAEGTRWTATMTGEEVSFRAAPPGRRWTAADASAPFATFLRGVARDLSAPLADAPLVSAAGAGEPASSYDRLTPAAPETLLARLSRLPALTDASVEDSRSRTTVRLLLERARHVAAALRGAGVRRADVVGLHLSRSSDYLVGVFAAWMCGAAFVPLDPRYPSERLRFIAENCGARVITVDGAAEGRHFPAALLRLDVEAAAATPDDGAPEGGRDASDVAYVLYTSGSSGRPKGVEVTHANLASFLAAVSVEPGLRPDEALCALTSFSFDISLLELLLPAWVGARLVIASEAQLADPAALGELWASKGVGVIQATPTTFRLLTGANVPLPPRRFVGGEAFPRELAAELLRSPGEIWNMYGPTETTVWSTCGRVDAPPAFANVPLGRPLANTVLRVVDERGRLVPVGCRGELLIGGDGVAKGYRGRADLTAERFVIDPTGLSGLRMYRTGDAVRLNDDGSLEFLGRLDSQVKVRGHRIELEEVEAALRRLPGVSAGAAAVHELGGAPTLVGYVVARAPLTAGEARTRLAETLPEYMVPTFIESLDALPLTPNSKLDRRSLPPPRALPPAGGAPTEGLVARALADAFGADVAIGPDDDFTALGGFSLARLALAKRLLAAGYHVEPATVYQQSTVRRLSAWLDAQGRGAPAPALGADDGEEPVSSYQAQLYADAALVPGSPRWNVAFALRLRDDVDADRLERAVRSALARHRDVLSSFHSVENRTFRRIHDAHSVPWEVRRLELEPFRLDESGPRGGVLDVLAQVMARPFDLSAGPPLRGLMLEGASERYLVWSAHEILMDARSANVLRREIDLAYEADGPAPGLAPPPRFRDHVAREGVAGARLDPAGGRAGERAVAPPRLEPGPPPAAGDVAVTPLRLDDFGPLDAAARARRGVSGFVLLGAAFALALAASEHPLLAVDRECVAFGFYADNRGADEGLGVGHYTVLLPLVASVPRAAAAGPWLGAFERGVRAALALEDVPTGALLARLPEAQRSRAWRVRLNDTRSPEVEGLPAPAHSAFADAFVPPVSCLGLHLELGASLADGGFAAALHDGTAVPHAVVERLLADFARLARALLACRGDEPLAALLGAG